MSEANRTNPNRKSGTRVTPLGKALGAAALVVVGLGAAEGPNIVQAVQNHQAHEKLVDNLQRPDALQEYLNGDQIPHNKVVRLQAPEDMSASRFATLIEKDSGNQWELTQQIKPQADAQLDPGLQGGYDQVVVEKALVDPAAVEKYGVEDINNPDRQDPLPPVEQGHTGVDQGSDLPTAIQ